MLLAAADEAFRGLDVPFGVLTCREDVAGFYARGGWERLPDPEVRMTTVHGEEVVHTGPTLVRPVTAPVAAWPPGPLDRAGSEV